MKQKKHWYLLAYDIRQPKRLQKLHYFISKHALAMQNSVFLFEAEPSTLNTILKGIAKRSHQLEDDIRLYPLFNPNQIWAAGKQAKRFEGIYNIASKRKSTSHKGFMARFLTHLKR
jgi:CRISPR-associated protein Cas2